MAILGLYWVKKGTTTSIQRPLYDHLNHFFRWHRSFYGLNIQSFKTQHTMKRLMLAVALLAGLGLSSCIDEREPEGSNPGKNKNATPAGVSAQDTMSRDNTGTMQNGGTSTNGGSSSGGGTGNGGQ